MKKSTGRPKTKSPTVSMAFRFRPAFAALIKKIASRENLSQARVVENAIKLFGGKAGGF